MYRLTIGLLFAIFAQVVLAAPTEYAVKAAFLTKFGIYVDWPGSAFLNSNAPIKLCIVGNDPFGTVLDQAAATQRIHGRAIVVLRIKAVTPDAGCHMLFIGSGDMQHSEPMQEILRGTNVLTVTDRQSGAGARGIINFVIKDDRVRFEINDAAAQKSGLTISSKLLSLALNVIPRH